MSAMAWAPEGWYTTEEELPTDVRALLPTEGTFDYGIYNGDTCFLQMKYADDVRQFLIVRETKGRQKLIYQSALLAPIGGSAVSVGGTSRNHLYLMCDDESWYFHEYADGSWRLTGGDNDNGIMYNFFPNGLGWHDENAAQSRRWRNRCLYGSFTTPEPATPDTAKLPHSLAEAVAMVDPSDWAVVNNPDPSDRLHLRTAAKADARSHGKFYNGTPVQVLGRSEHGQR